MSGLFPVHHTKQFLGIPAYIPCVGLANDTSITAIASYIAANPTTAEGRILGAVNTPNFYAKPKLADFSSRGPMRDYFTKEEFGLQKPDVTAPGIQVLAGYSPLASELPGLWEVIQGTSMSSPHAAGVFALARQKWPNLSAGKVIGGSAS